MPQKLSTYGIQRLVSNLPPDQLVEWEDDDPYAIQDTPKDDAAEATGGTSPFDEGDDYGNFGTNQPDNTVNRYREALNRKTVHEAMRPRLADHRPNKWQRLAAAAANFGAGYVNAGRRTQVDPVAMEQLNNSLLHPGYQRAVQDWSDQGNGIQAGVDAAANDWKIDAAQAKQANDARRAAAYERAQGASESLNQAREKKLGEDPWHISPTGRKMYKAGSGETKDLEEPKSPGPVKETPDEARARRAKEVESVTSLTPEQKDAYTLTGKIPAKPKASGGKGKGEKQRIGTPGQFRSVEKEKQAALKKAEDAFKKVTSDASAAPSDKAAALAALEAEKERIMAAYDAGVETLGGSVLPRGKNTPAESKPAPAPTQQSAAAPKYDEKTVRDSAIKAGKDPEFVVAEMKKRGLL